MHHCCGVVKITDMKDLSLLGDEAIGFVDDIIIMIAVAVIFFVLFK